VEEVNCHVGYVDKRYKKANNNKINCHMWKWMKDLFFHLLLHLAILNSYNHLSSYGGKKTSHREFQLALVKIMLDNIHMYRDH
jgi:hypothetical protein